MMTVPPMQTHLVTTRGIAAAAVLVAIALAAPALAQAPATPAQGGGPGVPVTAGTVQVADVPVVLNTIGTVQAFNMVTIKSRVDGQIVKADFNEGQEVKAGTPLVQIDPRPFQAALDQALATKDKDEAQLVSAQQDLARWAE